MSAAQRGEVSGQNLPVGIEKIAVGLEGVLPGRLFFRSFSIGTWLATPDEVSLEEL